MVGPTWAALGFGTLNAALFLGVVVRGEILELALDMPHVPAALWIFSILGAHWALRGVDLRHGAAGETERLLARGTAAGALVGAGTATVMFMLFPLAIGIGAVAGAVAGLACAIVDVLVLGAARAVALSSEASRR